ncbi:hypothetical protein T458_19805 [Brevibacillus panacihumi W25]|uniref:Uncharacterized protein n=1 Tax=Brevibacillus panacihumi W25 TaxID=1408254 RepID=V6M3D1_9BACL|nr:hypothetical protein [Brevibacillus panacihumi]EST53126.1 hypothetical protein T458_19805 [Brevibacillus panacihumi W25]
MNQERLGDLPIAQLTADQLKQLQATERELNNQDGKDVYLIAFEKQAPSQ